MGAGSGIEKYKNDIQRLHKRKDVEIITYGLGFMYCVNELDFHPDYHCFLDPVPFVPVQDYIKRNVGHKTIETKFLLLDPIHTRATYKDFQNFIGTTPLGRGATPWPDQNPHKKASWELFISATQNIIDDPRLNEVIVPCMSLKYIHNNPDSFPQYKDVDLVDKDFRLRFQAGRAVLKTQYNNPNLNEDKLTSAVLPMIQWLFRDTSYVKEVGIIGFELKGGRYMWNHDGRYYDFFRHHGHPGICQGIPSFAFCYDNNKGLAEARETTAKYMKLWNEHVDTTNLDLHSVVEPKYSLLNEYVKYKPIEEL